MAKFNSTSKIDAKTMGKNDEGQGKLPGGPFGFSEVDLLILRGTLLIALALDLGVYAAPRLIDEIKLDLDVDEAGLPLSTVSAMVLLSSALGCSAATGAFLMDLSIRGKRERSAKGSAQSAIFP